MKKLKTLLVFFLLCLPYAGATEEINASGSRFETAFTPEQAISPLIVKAVKAAQKSVLVAAHRFVSKEVSVALYETARQGRQVKILLDSRNNKDGYSEAGFLIAMSQHPHATKNVDNQYQDYIVIDDKDVIIGNIAAIAEEEDEKKNAASVLVIHNAPELAHHYVGNFQKLWLDSEEMKDDRK